MESIGLNQESPDEDTQESVWGPTLWCAGLRSLQPSVSGGTDHHGSISESWIWISPRFRYQENKPDCKRTTTWPRLGISALGLNEQPIKILHLAAPREEKGRRVTVRELIFMIPKSFGCLLFVAKAATFWGLTVCPALHMAHLFSLTRDPMGRVLSWWCARRSALQGTPWYGDAPPWSLIQVVKAVGP